MPNATLPPKLILTYSTKQIRFISLPAIHSLRPKDRAYFLFSLPVTFMFRKEDSTLLWLPINRRAGITVS